MNSRKLHWLLAPFSGAPGVSTAITIIALAVIVGFGSILRYQAFSESVLPRYPHGDAARFLVYAYNLKNFGIFSRSATKLLPSDTDPETARKMIQPDALVTPGYPIFLSRFLGGEFTEKQRDRVLFTQVVLSCLTILLAYLAFAPMGRTLALGVAALTALSPHLVNVNLFLLSEPLFCFLLMTFVWLVGFVREGTTWPLFLLIGLIFAMAALTRPWLQAYLFLLIPLLVFSSIRVPFRIAMLIFAGAAILFAPWMIRNAVSPGIAEDPPLHLVSLHHGMYPDMMFDDRPETLGYAYKSDPMNAELGKSAGTTLAELARRASEQPAKYLSWYLIGKTKSVLSWRMIAAADAVFVYHVENNPYFSRPMFYLSSYLMEQIHAPLMFLAIAGLLLAWLPARLQALTPQGLLFARAMSLLVLYFLLVHSVLAPYPRYSIPLRPVLYGMSLFTVLFIVQFARHRLAGARPEN